MIFCLRENVFCRFKHLKATALSRLIDSELGTEKSDPGGIQVPSSVAQEGRF